MDHEYKNVIFTDHALKRLKKRNITQDMVSKTLKQPENQIKEDNGNVRFTRTLSGRNVHVVANYLNDEKKWLVVSTWVRGEDDPQPLWLMLLTMPIKLMRKLFSGKQIKSKKRR